jgi:H+/Cl- antiporter ClcA
MFALGRFSPRRQPGLILAGAAAGVAAAFNTPLAGIVFGIEEMSRAFEVRTSGLIIGGVIAAGLTSMALVGDYTYFGTTSATLGTSADWLAVPVCGAIGGLAGGVFSRILILVAGGLPGKAGRWIKRWPVPFAILCGLGVAVCGLAAGGTTFGTGYEQIESVLASGAALPWSFGLLKFAATSLTSISGIPGGIFSPSLAIGGGVGLNLSAIFPGVPVGAMVLLGMVAYFAGVVQAPITAFVIVTEMTDNHAMMVPLMATALIASSLSRLVCPEGVYHALAKNFLRQTRGTAEPPAAAAG